MAIYLEIFFGVTAVIVALYYYFTAHFTFWIERGVPGPKPVPVFGNVMRHMLGLQSITEFAVEMRKKYKGEPLVGVFTMRKPTLMIQDPELIKHVFIKDFTTFADRGAFLHEIPEPLSAHLFSLESKRWRPLRTQLSPVFTSGKLRGTFFLILKCAEHLETYLDTLVKKGEPIESRELAAKFTTDVIGSCAFGIEMNSLSDRESEFRQVGREIFATHFLALLKLRMKECVPKLYDWLGYIIPYDYVTRFITKVTIETMDYRQKNNIVRPDFMNTLLELRKHPEKVPEIELTDTLLAAQAFVFFAAGFETSSTTISHALYELALNPDIQNKLRQEIVEFNSRNDGNWKYEVLKEMEYLDKVFNETLRKYPPLHFLTRVATDNYTFSGTKVSIPKGTELFISTFAIQRDPEIYPDPEKFDPERFDVAAKKARHPMHFLPFGDGPRNCIGARFAVYQTKIGLIKILLNTKVEVCEKTPIPYELHRFSFILSPTKPLYLKFTKVEN
ncbi:PREDICTED: probable cytochrome P450 6a14 [Dufourea novaeangliae]|uniref:probable cytochrome P450 6a14 n=1 Tax=Dufourea novaeangliae TaxID=178035 RepID=UPI0007673602|nr:PREDICTED: probable cytochrome P450 6a14 [Dufourea novaeangliae]